MKVAERLIKYILLFAYVWFMFVPEEICKTIFPAYAFNHNAIVMVIVLIVFLYSIRKKIQFNRQLITIIIFCVYVISNTAIHKGEISYSILMYSRVIATSLLIFTIIRKRDLISLKALTFSLTLLVTLNLISIISGVDRLIYSSLGHTFLLGFDNSNVIVVFPALIMNYFVNYLERDGEISFRLILSWVLTVISIIFIDSATTTLGFFIFVIMILTYKHELIKYINRKTLFVIVLMAFFFIVIFRLQNMFSVIIVNMLGRDITLTGRIALWDKAFRGISESPFLGHGINPEAQRLYFFGVSSAHSEILDILYQHGIVGLALYVWIFVEYFRTEKKRMDKSRKLFVRTIDSMIFSFLVMMIAESYNSYISYGLIFMIIMISSLMSSNIDWEVKYEKTIKIFEKKHRFFVH